MKTAKKDSKGSPRTEILTADPEGFMRFVADLRESNHGKTYRGMWGAQLTSRLGHYKTTPLSAHYDDAGVAPYIGPLNRAINQTRVDEYRGEMELGHWTFTPDPIVVTSGGHIINGQHRLLAVEVLIDDYLKALARFKKQKESSRKAAQATRKRVLAEEGLTELVAAQDKLKSLAGPPEKKPDTPLWPKFVIVWGADKKAALLMDEARRTMTDRRDIAIRFARANG